MEDTINILSAAQRGELLSALFRFARQERECPGSGCTDISGHPELDAVSYMAFLPIAQTIRRDTEKWQQKRERYQQAAVNRNDSRKKDEADCSWMRPYIERREKDASSEMRRYAAQLRREQETKSAEDEAWKYV